MSAAEDLADARTAFEHDAHARAFDLAWRAAATAAQAGDASTLEGVFAFSETLVAAGVEGAGQLRVYAEAALADAGAGTRPPSAFERLMGSLGRRR